MSYNGSGTFQINSSGQPVVTGTVISSTAFNALTADLATGLSTAITKDGQTTTTARITFAQGISSTLVTDATSATTGSIITAGGISTQKALWVGTTSQLVGLVTANAGISSTLTTDATSATTGSIITAGGISTQKALWVGTTSTLAGALTYGGVTLSNSVTGTGSMVLSASPTLTGTLTAVSANNTDTTVIGSFGANNQTQRIQIGFQSIAQYSSADPIRFLTGGLGGTEIARFNTSGQMCINSTSGSGKLSVATTNATAIYAVNSGTSSECMLTNVGGTGVAHVTFLYQGAGPVGSISSPNNLSVAYNTSSDERLKTVLPDQRDFRSIITDLWVGDVEWKALPGSRQMVMLAQQTHPLYPEAIRVGNTADDMWQADYAKLAPLALWGVKDLYAENEALKARLAALENK